MDAAVKLRSFEASYKQLVASLLRHEKILSSNEYGDTTTWIIKLIEMHNQHHIESTEESFHISAFLWAPMQTKAMLVTTILTSICHQHRCSIYT